MKSNTLRLGNLLTYNNDLLRVNMLGYGANPYNINCDILEKNIINFDTDKISPIPLTEEWLLKFGFKKSVIFFMKESMNIEFIENGCLFSLDGEYEVFIEHIHQLQNLYFALTNSELIIN